MAKQDINIGTQDAKAGDTLYSAFTKTEGNFTELYGEQDFINAKLDLIRGADPVAPAGSRFVADGFGGGEFIRIQGWAQYQDTDTTVGTPSQNIATGVRTKWTNDGGTLTIEKNPSDATQSMWDTTTNKIQPISAFDVYQVRVTFSAENYSGSTPLMTIELDIGGSIGVIASETKRLAKGGSEQAIMFALPVFAGSTFLANGGEIYLTYTGTGTCDIFKSSILIVRESKNYV